MRALSALTIANIRELRARPRGPVLDPGLPADLHLPVRVHLPGRRRRRPRRSRGSTRTARPRRPSCAPRSRRPTGSSWTDRVARRGRRSDEGRRGGRGDRRPGRVRRPRSAAASSGDRCAGLDRGRTPTRRARSSRRSVYQAVGSVLGVVNLGGRPPLVVPQPQTIQTENLNFISYFVPSILALSVMQIGIFAAVPLVADREKGILKRLSATPLRRWQLVGSNTLMRLLIALVQAVIIVGVGVMFFGVADHRLARCWRRRSSRSARSRSWRSATSWRRSPGPRTPPTASPRSSSSR